MVQFQSFNKISKGSFKKSFWNIDLWVALEPTSAGWLVASHSDVVNDIRFEMAAILDFHLQG